MGNVIKLTEDVLLDIIREVIEEQQHCKKHPTTRRLECEKADQASRRKSQEKRNYKETVWPGYYDRNGSIDQIQRGLMETSTDDDFKDKLRSFINSLTLDEKKRFRKLIAKPSQQDLMLHCSRWADATSGKLTIDPEKAIDLQMKAKKSRD